MAVVPSVPILVSPPSIRELVSLGNGTLGDTVHTVHLVCVELPDAVPVNSGTILVVVVLHVDHNLVSPTRLYQRSRECVIKNFPGCLRETIGSKLGTKNVSHVHFNLFRCPVGKFEVEDLP